MVEYAEKAAAKSAQRRAKNERVAIAEKRLKLKTRSDYINEAQNAVNAYVRFRDKDMPCISCGNPLSSDGIGGGFDAGHYRSRGSAPHLRFAEDVGNINGQCKRCNRYLGGNYSNYRIGLIERIGIDNVERLEAYNEPRKFTVEELKEITQYYKNKLKELKNAGA